MRGEISKSIIVLTQEQLVKADGKLYDSKTELVIRHCQDTLEILLSV